MTDIPMRNLLAGASEMLETMVRQIARGHEVESPIEEAMLHSLILRAILEENATPQINGKGPRTWCSITTQAQLGAYRVDFLVAAYGVSIAVECDGHDFHEKTKEQAARDKRRDRDVQMMGHLVMRFTGSEIYRDPWKAADTVISGLGLIDFKRALNRDDKPE
jgi:hypothetical protein